jgi:guanylate kinase
VNRGTDSEERITKRLERLSAELEYKSNFTHHIINDDVGCAVNEIMNILQHENEEVYYGS